ncbi:spike base protein, RCAP_Rcc01079 family [Pararhizobium antarcticum]|uniref:Uncharacterized protein n=1 Tax=Pararhizobium antarcticum TaxID=1798805 RepID=A0A657LU80_9HYPH|nr:hypothetical protein [Pararhizobium antarcticum]OJF97583.1 hypothetical protein AX760_16600 [Pararhizobium antarcticum]
MPDNPLNRGTNVGSDLVPVTPSDSVDLPVAGRAIRCRGDGAGGTIRFVANSGVLRNSYIAAGETILTPALRIHATGTTATLLEVYI